MTLKKRLSVYFLSLFLFSVFLPHFSLAQDDDSALEEKAQNVEIEPADSPTEGEEYKNDELAAEQNPPNADDDDEEDVRMVKAPSTPHPEASPTEMEHQDFEAVEAVKPQARAVLEKPLINQNTPTNTPRWQQELNLAHEKAEAAETPVAAMGCSLHP